MDDLDTHGIVALVRNASGQYLLLEDSREPMKGYWAPPHGRCESTDKSEEAGVIREVQEETGIEVMLNDESSSFGWFSLDEALALKLYPGAKLFFDKLKSGELSLN